MAHARVKAGQSRVDWLARALFAVALGLAAWLGLLFLAADNAHAVPASPRVFEIEQPDGTSFRARLYGDERRHGVETARGYTVVQNRRGAWTYAAPGPNGGLRASGRIVGVDGPGRLPRHLRSDEPVRQLGPLPAPVSETESEPALSALSPAPEQFAFDTPMQDVHHNLVILASFTDQPSLGTTPAQWHDRFFGPSRSLRDYYGEASDGALDVQPATETHETANDGVVGWLPLARNHPDGVSYDEERRAVRAAIVAADQYVDYASYDTNGDRQLAPSELHLTVIAAGYEESYSGSIGIRAMWGHRWVLFGNVSPPTLDGVVVGGGTAGGGYMTFGEMHDTHQATVGLVAHEFGHDIGWPDLYDTDDGGAGSWDDADTPSVGGVGDWSIMATGSWAALPQQLPGTSPPHPDAWSKYFQGWVQPTLVSGLLPDHALAAPGSGAAGAEAALVGLNPAGASDWDWLGNGEGEYFLVENRQPTPGTYDASLPAGGLLIWHINEANGDNDTNADRLVALEQADGANSLNLNGPNYGDPGDPYPGALNARTFGASTTPNSSWAGGDPSGISVTDISDPGVTMLATFDAPAGDLAITVTPKKPQRSTDFIFEVVVRNVGDAGAAGGSVTVQLPVNVALRSFPGGSCLATGTLTLQCETGPLEPGETRTFAAVVRPADLSGLTATTVVTPVGFDRDIANDTATATASTSLVCDNTPTGGRDIVVGTSAAETLCGLSGNDVLIGEAGNDLLFGGSGSDTVDYRSSPLAVAIDLRLQGAGTEGAKPLNGTSKGHGKDTLFSIERARGSAYADTMRGRLAAADILWGLGGADTIYGLSGRDTLYGGAGRDTLYGGDGADTLNGGKASDYCRQRSDTLISCER